MKYFKHFFAAALTVFMAFALAVPALAADPKGSITVTGAVTDPAADKTTYEAYRIFDMTTTGDVDDSGNYTKVAYTINSAWAGFFANDAAGAKYLVNNDTDPASLNQIVVGGVTKYINITDRNVATFAKEAYEYAMKTKVNATTSTSVDKGTKEVTFSNLDLGYYMVYPKGASVNIGNYTSIVSLTNTEPNGEIAQKAEYPTLNKVADDISVEVGQKVTYTLTSKVPDTTGYTKYEMDFSDKTTNGLTFDGVDSIVVKIGTATLTKGTDYSVDTTNADFKVTINMLKSDNTAKYNYGDEISVEYTATVNDAAVTTIDENHATLSYNNDPKNGSTKDTTPPVIVKVFSAKVEILKVDGKDTTKKLEGAKFVLKAKTVGTGTGETHETDLAAGKFYYYDATAKDVKWIEVAAADQTPEKLAANTNITVVTTDKDGKAAFNGLENGTYELIEVAAPAGYNLLTEPVEAEIAGTDADVATLTVSKTVVNNSGTALPSTGGIGTTIFYIVGGAMVLTGGVLLITKRRLAKIEG